MAQIIGGITQSQGSGTSRIVMTNNLTFYVDPENGSDANPGTAIAPWETNAKAAEEIAKYELNGFAIELKLIEPVVSEFDPLILGASSVFGSGSLIIDGNGGIQTFDSNDIAISIQNLPNVDIKIENATIVNTDDDITSIRNVKSVFLDACTFVTDGNGLGITGAGSGSCLIRDCNFQTIGGYVNIRSFETATTRNMTSDVPPSFRYCQVAANDDFTPIAWGGDSSTVFEECLYGRITGVLAMDTETNVSLLRGVRTSLIEVECTITGTSGAWTGGTPIDLESCPAVYFDENVSAVALTGGTTIANLVKSNVYTANGNFNFLPFTGSVSQDAYSSLN